MKQKDNSIEKRVGKYGKYTKDTILSIIKENHCITTSDLRKLNEYAWKKARDNGWVADLGLIRSKHEDGYWTKDRVYDVAKKYSNKNDFKAKEPTAYKWAASFELLDKFVWMKCPTYDERRNNHDSVVYAFVDEENKVAYVGLTIDEKSRAKSHRNSKNSAVRKYFGKNIPNPIVLKAELTVDESMYYEDFFKKQYIKHGYKILNVAPTGINVGSIGGLAIWTSKDVVFGEAKKYSSRTEFKNKAGGAYNHARINGWLDEMTWLKTPRRKIKWTYDAVLQEGRKYNSKKDFERNSKTAYMKANECGWIKDMTWLKSKKKPSNYWTKERVLEESKKYTNKKEFEKNAKGAYCKAVVNKWLDEMPWLCPLPLGPISKWSREAIIEESKKYKTKTEFAKKSPTAYIHAIEDKSIFNQMPWLEEKKKPDGYWKDKVTVIEESKKYKSRTQFANGSYSAWKMAKKTGWIDEMTWLKNPK